MCDLWKERNIEINQEKLNLECMTKPELKISIMKLYTQIKLYHRIFNFLIYQPIEWIFKKSKVTLRKFIWTSNKEQNETYTIFKNIIIIILHMTRIFITLK